MPNAVVGPLYGKNVLCMTVGRGRGGGDDSLTVM